MLEWRELQVSAYDAWHGHGAVEDYEDYGDVSCLDNYAIAMNRVDFHNDTEGAHAHLLVAICAQATYMMCVSLP